MFSLIFCSLVNKKLIPWNLSRKASTKNTTIVDSQSRKKSSLPPTITSFRIAFLTIQYQNEASHVILLFSHATSPHLHASESLVTVGEIRFINPMLNPNLFQVDFCESWVQTLSSVDVHRFNLVVLNHFAGVQSDENITVARRPPVTYMHKIIKNYCWSWYFWNVWRYPWTVLLELYGSEEPLLKTTDLVPKS